MTEKLEEEIKRLEKTIASKNKEIMKLSKRGALPINWFTILSLVLIVCSFSYYIKVRDEEHNQFMAKTAEDLETKVEEITALNKELEASRKALESVSNELKTQKTKSLIIDLDKDLDSVGNETKKSGEKMDTKDKDKQIKDLLDEIKSRDAENALLLSQLNHDLLIAEAREESPEVIFSSNETMQEAIIWLIEKTLWDEGMVTFCKGEAAKEFNVYKSCFRDTSIILHNYLMKYLGPQWSVTSGLIDHCFSVSLIDDVNREEYYFRFKNVYFQIFKYSQNVTIPKGLEKEATDEMAEEVKKRLNKEVDKEVKNEVKEEVKEGVKKEVDKEAKKEAKSEVKEGVKNEVKKEVDKDVKKEVKSEVKEKSTEEAKNKVKEEVKTKTKTDTTDTKAEAKAKKASETKTGTNTKTETKKKKDQ